MKKIVISCKLGETCAAVIEDGSVSEIHFSREDSPKLVGNIYKGRVKNFLPGMQFNGAQKFSVGQSVLLQIDKDEVGAKGARATLNISLAGHFVIFLPTLGYVGVSNKIRGAEKERLHALAKKIRSKETGIIVRTAAEGCDEEILRDDFAQLKKLWAEILERYSKRKPPALLHDDNDLIEKILRDDFTDDTEFITDNKKIYRRLGELVPKEKIIFYDDDEKIFEAFGVAEEILKINQRELSLPSGGQIVIDKTEALTAIDVNTGSFVGDENFDETILKTNLEAAELILKQLKLRDMGGIIIVDFIDMQGDAHKKSLMNFLRERAAQDRNKTKIVDMTPLGLVEITRHG